MEDPTLRLSRQLSIAKDTRASTQLDTRASDRACFSAYTSKEFSCQTMTEIRVKGWRKIGAARPRYTPCAKEI